MTDHTINETAAEDIDPDSGTVSSDEGAALDPNSGAAQIEVMSETPTAESLGLTLPRDPQEATALLLRELGEARAESGDLLDSLKRLAAEFDNHRKRTERDQVENIKRASQRVIESLLPALDSLDAALAIEATSDNETRMLEGMAGTRTLILETLDRDGAEPIEAIGQPFDPALHEAVSVNPGDGEQIVEQELRKGYVMQGRVIRPSLVIVGHA
jgi:molecular chaperone GrpE